MRGEIEYADGRARNPEILKRGRLEIGKRLLAERNADDKAGRPHRKLSMVEMRSLLEVQEAEVYRHRR